MKFRPKKSSLNLGNCSKLVARYCEPFEILARIGPIAHELSFLACIKVHNVFHVSLLKKYIPDANHVVDWNVIQMEKKGYFLV